MYPLESMPILIESHRQYLRDLFDPRAGADLRPSRRERLGVLIVRLGQAVANQRPGSPQGLATGAPATLSHQ